MFYYASCRVLGISALCRTLFSMRCTNEGWVKKRNYCLFGFLMCAFTFVYNECVSTTMQVETDFLMTLLKQQYRQHPNLRVVCILCSVCVVIIVDMSVFCCCCTQVSRDDSWICMQQKTKHILVLFFNFSFEILFLFAFVRSWWVRRCKRICFLRTSMTVPLYTCLVAPFPSLPTTSSRCTR